MTINKAKDHNKKRYYLQSMAEQAVSKQLPSISVLFKESWETFKGSLLNLFLLYLISFGVFLGMFIVGLLITLPLGAFSIITALQNNELSPAFFTSLGAMGIVILILIIIGIIINMAVNAAMIMAVADYKNKPSAGALFKKGFSFVLPLLLASIVTGFIVMGGYLLLFIPGIVFALALGFTSFEIVLQKKNVLAAMRRSMGIVFSNFWGILGRMLLFMVLVLLVMFIPQIISSASSDSGVSAGFGIFSFFINIALGWFGISYFITLYKQASAVTLPEKSGKLLLPLILSVVGWILGIILIVTITTAVMTFMKNVSPENLLQSVPNQKQIDALQKYQNDPSTLTEQDMRSLLNLLPTDSPERAEFEKIIDQQFNGNGMMGEDSMMEGTIMPTRIPNSY